MKRILVITLLSAVAFCSSCSTEEVKPLIKKSSGDKFDDPSPNLPPPPLVKSYE